jgi:hypothetical protein
VTFLTEQQRRTVFDKVITLVDTKFIGTDVDVKRLREAHEPRVVGSSTQEDFEQALDALLRDLNRVREFAEFLITPLRPGPNLDRYERELRRPFPSTPQFALDSGVWRREHTIEPPTRSTGIAEPRQMLA